MSLRLHLAVAALVLAPTLARADSFTTFYVSDGTFQNGGTFSGSFVLDTTNDRVQSGAITVSADGYNQTLTNQTNFGLQAVGRWVIDGSNQLYLIFDASVTAPSLCLYGQPSCNPAGLAGSAFSLNGGQDKDHVTGGTISTSPVAPAPEPSSLVLLGTGVLGMAGVARRQLLRSMPASARISKFFEPCSTF